MYSFQGIFRVFSFVQESVSKQKRAMLEGTKNPKAPAEYTEAALQQDG